MKRLMKHLRNWRANPPNRLLPSSKNLRDVHRTSLPSSRKESLPQRTCGTARVRLPAGRLRVGQIKQHSTSGTMCAAPLNRQRAVMFAASLQETIVDAMLSWREVAQHLHLHASAGEDLPARAIRPILNREVLTCCSQ